MTNRYRDEFPTFPGEYRRKGLDHIKFLPYKELQKTCRVINGENSDTSKIYSACTKQYFFNCEDEDYFRPPSVTYFLKGIDKEPDFFENIRAHEDAHQQAIFARNLVHCHNGESSISKTAQDTINNLNILMDRQEYVECDEYGKCSFKRSFDMQQRLEEALDWYLNAIHQEKLKKQAEELQRNFQED